MWGLVDRPAIEVVLTGPDYDATISLAAYPLSLKTPNMLQSWLSDCSARKREAALNSLECTFVEESIPSGYSYDYRLSPRIGFRSD